MAGRQGQNGAEFAGGEVVEGAQAGGKIGRAETASAIEPTEEVRGWRLPFAGIAFEAAGDQIAVGVGSQAHLRDDMIEALHAGGDAAQAVEAKAALARVDGFAQHAASEEIELVDVGGIHGATVTGERCAAREARAAENFAGQEYLDDVTRFAASKQAQ